MALSNADNPVAEAKPARRVIRTEPAPAVATQPAPPPEPDETAPAAPTSGLRRAGTASDPRVHYLLARGGPTLDADLAELGYAL